MRKVKLGLVCTLLLVISALGLFKPAEAIVFPPTCTSAFCLAQCGDCPPGTLSRCDFASCTCTCR